MTSDIKNTVFQMDYQKLKILNNHIEAFYKDAGDYYKVIVIIQNLWHSAIKTKQNLDDLQKKVAFLPDFFERKKMHFLYIFNHVDRKDCPISSWSPDIISCAKKGTYHCFQRTTYFKEEIKEIRKCLKKQELREKTFSINDMWESRGFPFITVLIILICVCVFLLNPNVNKYGVSGNTLLNGNYYSIFTYAFLHAGVLHLVNNCVSLAIVGSMLEKRIGKLQYIILFIIAIGYSGVVTGIYKIIFNESSITTVGISGFVFAVYAALYLYQKKYKKRSGIILTYMVISLLIGFVNSSTDNVVHLVGVCVGMLFMSIHFMMNTIRKNMLFIQYAKANR